MPDTPLTDAINALTSYANSVTGEADETLSDAVRSLADGYNPNGISIDGMADGSQPNGDITVNVERIEDYALRNRLNITGLTAPNCVYIGTQNFLGNTKISSVDFPKCVTVGGESFRGASSYGYDSDFVTDFPVVETIDHRAFRDCSFRKIVLPETLKSISGPNTFAKQMRDRVATLKEVYFRSKPTTGINNGCFAENPNLTDIYVPWSQGEVANAPWGAQNATIHYDTVYDSDWNVISST